MKKAQCSCSLKGLLLATSARPEIRFLRRLRSDSSLGLPAAESSVIKSIQVKPERSVYSDRFWEWRTFYGISTAGALIWFVRNGWPFSKRLHNTLMSKFDGKTGEGTLFQAYDQTALHYSAELMLSMHRLEWVLPFFEDIRNSAVLSQARVLEYGCGVSDHGLIFSKLGANVTIVDLQNRKLDFAEWRYQIRSLNVKVLGLADTISIPPLQPGCYDLVLATEILEHVRDPLILLRALTESLKIGGLLFSSMGLSFDRDIGGDHLAEAAEIGQSEAYQNYFREHFALTATREGHPWLFTRIK